MNNIDVRYSVGALLYSPALNDKIASSILNGQFGKTYSVALCLEDTIADSAVGQALEQLGNTFKTLHLAFAIRRCSVRISIIPERVYRSVAINMAARKWRKLSWRSLFTK